MENSLNSWTWKYWYEGWIGNCGSTSLRGGWGSPIRAGWTVPSDDWPHTFPMCWGDLRKVRSFPRTPTWLFNFSIAPKFRIVSWIVTTGLFRLERAMRSLLQSPAQSRFSTGFRVGCLGFCPVGSWKVPRKETAQPFLTPIPKLGYPHSKKNCWLEPLLSLSVVSCFFAIHLSKKHWSC